jgi:hypothetical protein
MAPELAAVIELSRPTKPLRHNDFSLTKPCTHCDRPAAYKATLSTGIDDVWFPTVMRSCVEHLPVTVSLLWLSGNAANATGDHPVLFPWAVSVESYQR